MSTINLDKLSINIDQQSTLARLLAQENITVIHGNYRTAWFDPERRVLALPIWKNRGKAVYDLLTGHEVGHALYTPAKGWHDAVDDIAGAPKAYLNVLEDVRIERKIQDRYPGLRLQFKKAYKVLAEEDFFGIAQFDNDFTDMIVIDRINLHYKLGEYVPVEFADGIETSFMRRAFMTETFDDVVALAKEIYAYQKELYKQQQSSEKETQVQTHQEDVDSEMDNLNPNDYHKPDTEEDQEEDRTTKSKKAARAPESKKDEQSDEKNSPEQTSDNLEEDLQQIKGTKKPDDAEQKPLESDKAIDSPASKQDVDDSLEMLDAITDQAFRSKESDLVVGNELSNTMVYTLNRVDDPKIVIDYKEYYSEWKKELSELLDWRAESVKSGLEYNADRFKKFKIDTEQAGAYMAKEFELRKAAYQYSRASVHKTGILNTNKLHAYKYSEDIFLKSTKLANYKNHGMLMYIDFSGSMQDNIGPTIRQLLNLTTFCKMVNIPYEVYAFTTRVKYKDEDETHDAKTWRNFSDCEIIPQKFNLLNLMSSRMSRSEYQEGFRMLWNLSQAWDSKLTNSYINTWNQLHSTPLNTCIAYANEQIKKFKAKHGVEKMITMFLTDGASDTFQVRMTEEGEKHRPGESGAYWRSRGALVRFAGNTLDVKHINSAQVTQEMLKTLKKNTGSTVLGFFISQYRNEAVSIVCDATSYSKKDSYVEQMNKNRAIIQDNIFGYDRYFGLCNKYMDIVENEFGEMVEDGASKGKLKTAFSKMTKQKRVNRILLNAFVDSIA